MHEIQVDLQIAKQDHFAFETPGMRLVAAPICKKQQGFVQGKVRIEQREEVVSTGRLVRVRALLSVFLFL